MIRIEEASDLDLVRELFREYENAIGVDLSFQGFSEELKDPQALYEAIFIAILGDDVAGCIALHRIDEQVCEMKRLYVRSRFRGHHVGSALVHRVMEEARHHRYRRMRLDTLPSMTDAIAMYERMGFRDIEPYRYNPIAGSRFMEIDL